MWALYRIIKGFNVSPGLPQVDLRSFKTIIVSFSLKNGCLLTTFHFFHFSVSCLPFFLIDLCNYCSRRRYSPSALPLFFSLAI